MGLCPSTPSLQQVHHVLQHVIDGNKLTYKKKCMLTFLATFRNDKTIQQGWREAAKRISTRDLVFITQGRSMWFKEHMDEKTLLRLLHHNTPGTFHNVNITQAMLESGIVKHFSPELWKDFYLTYWWPAPVSTHTVPSLKITREFLLHGIRQNQNIMLDDIPSQFRDTELVCELIKAGIRDQRKIVEWENGRWYSYTVTSEEEALCWIRYQFAKPKRFRLAANCFSSRVLEAMEANNWNYRKCFFENVPANALLMRHFESLTRTSLVHTFIVNRFLEKDERELRTPLGITVFKRLLRYYMARLCKFTWGSFKNLSIVHCEAIMAKLSKEKNCNILFTLRRYLQAHPGTVLDEMVPSWRNALAFHWPRCSWYKGRWEFIFPYLSDREKTMPRCFEAVKQDPLLLKHVPQALMNESICYMALHKNPEAVEFVPRRFYHLLSPQPMMEAHA